MQRCSENTGIQQLILIFSSVNSLDESALETLENLIVNLRQLGITLNLSDVKGILDDQLKQTNFYANLLPGTVFTTANDAMSYFQDKDVGNKSIVVL